MNKSINYHDLLTKLFYILILLTVVSIITACRPADEPEHVEQEETKTPETVIDSDREVAVIINGKPFYKDEIPGNDIQGFILNEVLYLEGLRRNIDEKIEDQVEEYKKNLIRSEVSRDIFKNIPRYDPTEEELLEFFNENRHRYTHLTVGQIATNTREIAEEIHKKALEGMTFKEIAAEYPRDRVYIYITEHTLHPRFNHIFDKMEVGEVSDIQRGRKGFEIFRITEVRDVEFERALPAVRADLVEDKRKETRWSRLQKLIDKNEYEIEIIQEKEK